MAEIGGLNLASNQGVEPPPVAMPDVAPVAPENAPETPLAQSATDKLRGERIRLDQHIQRLQDSLSSRTKSPVDQSWLKMAQAFLAPTKTGSFGESAGAAAGAYADEQAKQKTQEQSDLENQFKIAQLQYGMHKENVTDDLKRDFLASWGKPNDIKKVPVTLPDGTEGTKDVPYFNQSLGIKEGVQSGVIPLDKLIELQMKQEKQGTLLTDAEAKAIGLDTTKGQHWNKTATGTYEIVSGTKPPEDYKVGERQTTPEGRVNVTREYKGNGVWAVVAKSAIDKPEDKSSLSNDAIDVGAYTFIKTGKMPPLARSKQDYEAMLERATLITSGAYANPVAQKSAQSMMEGKQDFVVSQKALQNFATGKQGDSVRYINVGINHMATLDKAIDAMDNFDIPMANRLVNPFKVELGKDTVTNFNAIKGIVSDEITKAILGSAGALADRLEIKQQLSDASSLEQLKGALVKYKELFAGQLGGLKQQYEANTGRTDFDKKIGSDAVSLLSLINKNKPNTPAISAEDEALINKHLQKKTPS